MPEQFTYLTSLLVVIGCLALLDHRFKLAFWHDRRAAALAVGIGTLVFIAWDLFAIQAGIFNHGGSAYMLPTRIYKDFPLEELFFLILLCYQALLLYRFTQKYYVRKSDK